MAIDRRQALRLVSRGAWLAAASALMPHAARAQQADQWLQLKGDDGQPVPNAKLPVELTSELDELPGIIWVGSSRRDVTLIELYDFNCPWCHKAAEDVGRLLARDPEVRVGLLNNPILSPASAQAAKVELAILKLRGPKAAFDFHRKMFARRGQIDGQAALKLAASLGVKRAEIEAVADSDEVRIALTRQMRLAANLGLSATPSFVVGGIGIAGYPGTAALDQVLAAMRQCDQPAC